MGTRASSKLTLKSPYLSLVLLGVGAAVWTTWIIRGLLLSIVTAAFIAILFSPLRTRLLQRLRGRKRLVATLLTIAALLLIVLPTGAVLYLLAAEILKALAAVKVELGSQGVARLFEGHLPPLVLRLVHSLQQSVAIPTEQLEEQVAELAQRLPAMLGRILAISLRSIVNLLFVAFGLFYFFLDGDRLVHILRDVSPLKRSHTDVVWVEFQEGVRAMLLGSAVSVASGAVICILGFFAMGVPNALFWGTMSGLFTVAPGFGSAVIWVPLAAVLAMQGHVLQAIGVASFCAVALVIVNDTLLRPLIVGQGMRLHPYIILVSMFGGVEAYGIAGLIVGPMAATLAVTALRLYRRELVRSRGSHVRVAADTGSKSAPASQQGHEAHPRAVSLARAGHDTV